MSSSRFPGKMFEKINGIPLVEYVYKRCSECKKADMVAVLTSIDSSDDILAKHCHDSDILFFRGDLKNVLKRYIDGAQYFKADNVVRVCGDSPFVDVDLMDEIIQLASDQGLEYAAVTNCLNGFLSEYISLHTLMQSSLSADLSELDVEHVTKYIKDRVGEFKSGFLDANARPRNLECYTLTVDHPSDIEIARDIARHLVGFNFKSTQIIDILQKIKG